jgi:hypothetical protein
VNTGTKNIDKSREPTPLTPTQESFLENWLKKRKKSVDLQNRKIPGGHHIDQNLNREPMPLLPTEVSPLENGLEKLKEPADPLRDKPPAGHQKGQNLKWSDDARFRERFGDPEYYNRIKGL